MPFEFRERPEDTCCCSFAVCSARTPPNNAPSLPTRSLLCSSGSPGGNGSVLPVGLRGVAYSDREEDADSRRPGSGGGLVLIKSFKTGGTTLATYIAQARSKQVVGA